MHSQKDLWDFGLLDPVGRACTSMRDRSTVRDWEQGGRWEQNSLKGQKTWDRMPTELHHSCDSAIDK